MLRVLCIGICHYFLALSYASGQSLYPSDIMLSFYKSCRCTVSCIVSYKFGEISGK